jgi:hypothetical protein
MSFIRTLSVNGIVLGTGLSFMDRSERIRVAIIQQKLEGEKFSEDLTFAQAYHRCYERPLEMRRVARDARQRPTDFYVPEEDDEDDEDDIE